MFARFVAGARSLLRTGHNRAEHGGRAIAAAPGPAECLTALQAFVPKRSRKSGRPGFTSSFSSRSATRRLALAKSCLARFDAATIKPANWPARDLYIAADRRRTAVPALTRALAATLPRRTARALTTAITRHVERAEGDERTRARETPRRASTRMRRHFDQKFGAHSRLLGTRRGAFDRGASTPRWIRGVFRSRNQRKDAG